MSKSPLFQMAAGIVNAQAALVRSARCTFPEGCACPSEDLCTKRRPAKSAKLNPRLLRKVNTTFVHPPITVRHMDWQATFEGYEPGDSIGTGATEQEAIDWLIAEEAWAIAHEHKKEAA